VFFSAFLFPFFCEFSHPPPFLFPSPAMAAPPLEALRYPPPTCPRSGGPFSFGPPAVLPPRALSKGQIITRKRFGCSSVCRPFRTLSPFPLFRPSRCHILRSSPFPSTWRIGFFPLFPCSSFYSRENHPIDRHSGLARRRVFFSLSRSFFPPFADRVFLPLFLKECGVGNLDQRKFFASQGNNGAFFRGLLSPGLFSNEREGGFE